MAPSPAVEQFEPDDYMPTPATRERVITHSLPALFREWLTELKMLGRSPQTLTWYQQKTSWYLRDGEAKTLEELTAFELKRFLTGLQERGLSDNTVHGFFQILHSFANWAVREGYPVDPAFLRVRAPKVAQKEMATYTPEQLQAIFRNVPAGWARTAVAVLLGTGMRVSELCALQLDDLEDDPEFSFLKIRRGKGAKFRRVPITQRLRRELTRYVNRERPDSRFSNLLLSTDGRPVAVLSVCNMFQRTATKVGFPVHAHRFRHTFATEYLRRGGEMERLRKILGHTTYTMVMRYVHLDKGDLGRDFEMRSPF